MIILDPPKFAARVAHVDQACRGYKDLNRLALKLLEPCGYLMTYSRSGHISSDLFQKVVFSASFDPSTLAFPETEYLKGPICQTL